MKRFIFGLLALVAVGAVVIAVARNPSLISGPSLPFKKDLGRTLALTPGDLVSFKLSAKAGTCEWNPLKSAEAGRYRKAVERLLRLPVYEMSPEAPEGCRAAYYVDDETNSYKFLSGRLTIPPSGQSPQPKDGIFNKFYRVKYKPNEKEESREFCLSEADFVAAVATIKENPALTECNF